MHVNVTFAKRLQLVLRILSEERCFAVIDGSLKQPRTMMSQKRPRERKVSIADGEYSPFRVEIHEGSGRIGAKSP